jgi:hypothetical protein
MKVKLTFEYDTDSGEYEMIINNLSSPGQGVPLKNIQEAIRRITSDVEKQVTGLPEIEKVIARNDN